VCLSPVDFFFSNPHFSFFSVLLAGFDEAGSRQSFQKTDRNGDGHVDMSEFLKFLLELQQVG